MASLDTAPAFDKANQLAAILEQEFAALRAQDLTTFQGLQDYKQELLETLNAIAQTHGKVWNDDPDWSEVITTLRACHEAHRRNESLLRRQLDVVRMALSALTRNDEPDLYDHLGPGGTRAQRVSKAYGE